MKKTLLLAMLAISAAVTGQRSARNISMVYTDTDPAYVLQAISKQTGESILYSNKTKITITINYTAHSVEDAIQAVSSAAGLVERKIKDMYVVAPQDSMKAALAPYSHSASFPLMPGWADQFAPKIQSELPYATVQAIGNRITVTGVPEDIQEASRLVEELAQAQPAQRNTIRTVVSMHHVYADDVAGVIKALYPDVQVTASTSTHATAAPIAAPVAGQPAPVNFTPQSYGFIALVGPENMVADAEQELQKLDSPYVALGPNKIVFNVYNVKYNNAPSLVKFLKQTMPELDAFVGPEDYSPLRGEFNPLVAQLSSGGYQGTSATSSGGAGGGSASSGAGSTTPTTVPGQHVPVVGDRAKALVIKGRQSDVDAAMKLLADIDVKPKQVVIEVKVIETNPTAAEQIGVGYSFSPVNFYDVAPGTLLTNAAGAVTQTAGSTQSLGPKNFSRTPLNFTATLNALVTKSQAKLLAEPSLIVIDNDSGSFFIGNTVSVELQGVGPLGATQETIAQFPVGIILVVSPSISSDGNVTLHVNPVVSAITALNADGIPQTTAREAETTMIIHDGDTVVLGGLIQDQDTTTISSVPLLSQIPIIGELFKSRTHNRNRDDILVSITPHIVKDTPVPGK